MECEGGVMSKLIGAGFGLLVVYLTGALVAWNMNPGDWGILWRFWCVGWAIIWVIGCVATVAAIEDQR